ncbi:MAG: 3-oxoacyl-ACP reductase [Myxococcota bacterium]
MADFLLDLASNPRARKVVSTLGLPLPMPERLERGSGPWEARPLQGRAVVVDVPAGGALAPVLARTLAEAGADPWVVGDEAERAPFVEAGEAWARPPKDGASGPDRPWALILDATGVADPAGLRRLYDFFHPRIKGIGKSGRLLVIGRPAEGTDAAKAAAAHALTGFVRSAGREIGRRGATANLVQVELGAEDRLTPVLRFLLSPRAAYVDGQVLHVGKRCAAAEPVPVRPLDGKVVLVTGAARGIGESIAEVAGREGARVVVIDRPDDAELGAAVARRVGGLFLGCDVTAEDAPRRIADFVAEQGLEKIDVIVNNAGVTRDKTLANMSPEWWDLTIDVNLLAPIRLTEKLEPLFGPNARVVCLSSIAGIAGNVGQTNYAASKAGVIGAVRALAEKFAEKGVAVNAIAPGFIETRLTDAIPVATREVARRMSDLGQGGLPVDVAEVAVFLASPGAHGLTGQVVRVCGGNYVGA